MRWYDMYDIVKCMRWAKEIINRKRKVLRAPLKIEPTKTTNLVVSAVRARNTLATGHRYRHSRIGEAMI